jgi:hypothetical protein
MKKLVVLFVALTFLVTVSLIGCNQSQPPAKPAAEKGAPGPPGAAGAPGEPGAPGAPGAPAPEKK